jgi:hypothetical protein
MAFTRGQTQVLYQFLTGAIFEHDQYGFCRVTDVEFRETRTNQDALFNAVADLLAQWRNDQFRSGFADPRNRANRRHYVVGAPTLVRFTPYPTLLECRGCRRVFRLRDLMRRANVQPRRCPTCQGTLGQLRYVQAHNCGRLEEIFYPATACRAHGSQFLTFDDTGRVRSARWRCGACGNAEVARLRMTPCTCPYSSALPPGPGAQFERGLKTLALTDSALYLPHVVPFINFDEEQERGLTGDSELLCLVLARTWGLLDRPLQQVVRERSIRREQGTTAAHNDAMMENMVRALEQHDPSNALVIQWRRQQADQANRLDENAIRRVRTLLGTSAPSRDTATPRQLLEHIAVLDTLNTTSVPVVRGWLNELGDQDGAERIEQAAHSARENLGIGGLKIVGNFPIALCAVGYTRITRDPNRSVFSPFESSDAGGRTPLYVVSAETEGIYLQLDPIRVVNWLIENRWTQGPAPTATEDAWAWLYRNVPGLAQSRWDANYFDPMTVAVRTLLHTISHVLLRHVEWSGFSQNSVGEYLLPGALASVLYANRYAETKIGGLITLFEQRLGIWLDDSAQSGRECVYDPFCTDEGGTCVGCLHREYNCPQFNRELTRAVLYGGPTPPPELGSDLGIPSIRRGFWEFVRPAGVAVNTSATQV